jgi:structural maintenance of chromosome 1
MCVLSELFVNGRANVCEKDELIIKRFLWKLFHIESQIDENVSEITRKNKELRGLRKEQSVHDKALEEARAAQAKARSDVTAAEKKVKKAEKALENRVCIKGYLRSPALLY